MDPVRSVCHDTLIGVPGSAQIRSDSAVLSFMSRPDDGIRIEKGQLIQKQDLTIGVESQEKFCGQTNRHVPGCGDTLDPKGWTERHQRSTWREIRSKCDACEERLAQKSSLIGPEDSPWRETLSLQRLWQNFHS